MTVSPLPAPHRPTHPHRALLDAVGHALGEAVRALLDDDRVAARRILRDGATRHRLALDADAEAQRHVVGSGRRRQAAQDLLLVADVARISQHVDELARLVLTGKAGRAGSLLRRDAVLALGRFGEERLHQLADGLRAPELSGEFLRCGRCLLEAADCLDSPSVLDRGRPQPGTRCCGELATAVLQASRHALRATAV